MLFLYSVRGGNRSWMSACAAATVPGRGSETGSAYEPVTGFQDQHKIVRNSQVRGPIITAIAYNPRRKGSDSWFLRGAPIQ
ncbi:hypothetical protein BDV19DRAFT_335784 [Aspergillus venezuelensis]